MNWRNVQIFGMKEIRMRRVLLIIGAVLLGVFAWAFSFSHDLQGGSPLTSPTTLAVQDIPAEEGQTTAQEFVTTVQEVVTAPSELLRDYTLLPGQCAVEVKQADDDLLDVQSYLTEFESAYERLKQQYEDQRASLETTYEPQLARLRQDIAKAQRDLTDAQARLDAQLSSCVPSS